MLIKLHLKLCLQLKKQLVLSKEQEISGKKSFFFERKRNKKSQGVFVPFPFPKIWFKNFPKIWFFNQILGKGKGKGNKRETKRKQKGKGEKKLF
jgi:hypothetical protein